MLILRNRGQWRQVPSELRRGRKWEPAEVYSWVGQDRPA